MNNRGRSSLKPTATDTELVRGRLILADEAATRKLARHLASAMQRGDVIGLEGSLGAGKSTLVREMIRSLAGAPIEVPSPTFSLLQVYELPVLRIVHADLYRLTGGEVWELSLEEEAEDSCLLIEWPDRLPPGLFADRLTISFDMKADGSRPVVLSGPARRWRQTIENLVQRSSV